MGLFFALWCLLIAIETKSKQPEHVPDPLRGRCGNGIALFGVKIW